MIIIGQVSQKEEFESFFEGSFPESNEFSQNWNLQPGDKANVLTLEKTHEFQQLSYGLIPFWSTNSRQFFEAPIDGDSPVGENGEIKKRIINIPAFRKPIRESRCIIPTDYFILQKEGEAYLFFHQERQPFSIAGIYDRWKRNIKEPISHEGFSILTFPATGIFKELGFERVPMLIEDKRFKYWLRDSLHLTEVTSMLKFFPEEKLNGYQVDFEKVKEKLNERSITMPKGKFLQPFKKEPNKLIDYLRKNKYRKGMTHSQSEQEQRIWRDPQNKLS